jgi:hypothetical protein
MANDTLTSMSVNPLFLLERNRAIFLNL